MKKVEKNTSKTIKMKIFQTIRKNLAAVGFTPNQATKQISAIKL